MKPINHNDLTKHLHKFTIFFAGLIVAKELKYWWRFPKTHFEPICKGQRISKGNYLVLISLKKRMKIRPDCALTCKVEIRTLFLFGFWEKYKYKVIFFWDFLTFSRLEIGNELWKTEPWTLQTRKFLVCSWSWLLDV